MNKLRIRIMVIVLLSVMAIGIGSAQAQNTAQHICFAPGAERMAVLLERAKAQSQPQESSAEAAAVRRRTWRP